MDIFFLKYWSFHTNKTLFPIRSISLSLFLSLNSELIAAQKNKESKWKIFWIILYLERWEGPLESQPADEIPELCFCLLFEPLLLFTSLFDFNTQASPLHSYLFDTWWSSGSAKQLKMFGIKAIYYIIYSFEFCWINNKIG